MNPAWVRCRPTPRWKVSPRATVCSSADGCINPRPDLLEQLSPLPRAHAVTAPLLLVHGLSDTNVPPRESQQMFEALTAVGRRAELLLFDDDGHAIDKRENRALLLKAMMAWLTDAFVG